MRTKDICKGCNLQCALKFLMASKDIEKLCPCCKCILKMRCSELCQIRRDAFNETQNKYIKEIE